MSMNRKSFITLAAGAAHDAPIVKATWRVAVDSAGRRRCRILTIV